MASIMLLTYLHAYILYTPCLLTYILHTQHWLCSFYAGADCNTQVSEHVWAALRNFWNKTKRTTVVFILFELFAFGNTTRDLF